MKRALGVRLVALTLATTFGCGNDEVPVNMGGSDAGPDAGSTSVAPSTTELATRAEESSDVTSWTTTVASTSDGDGTLNATLGNGSTAYGGGTSIDDTDETATTDTRTELTSTAGGSRDVTSVTSANDSSSAVVSLQDGGTQGATTTDAETSEQSSDDTVTGTAADTGEGCGNSEDCTPPSNPCLVAMCHENLCVLMPIASGEEARAQTPGDCRVLRCDGTGNSIDAAADDDVPDDGLDCTLDTCTNGVLEYPSATPGTACDDGSGTMCDDWGNCVECLAPGDCPGEDGECEWRTCIDNICGVGSADASTPLESQTLGNCATETCGGSLIDDEDLPNDHNPCTADSCSNGVPVHDDEDPGLGCGVNSVCDGSGTCVGCNVPSDCEGSDDECKTRTCIEHSCGVNYTPEGTALTSQTDGDCRESVCDGAGNYSWRSDDADEPTDEEGCSAVSCSEGTAVYSPLGSNVACGPNDALYCDGFGHCVECNVAAQCGTDTDCATYTCNENACGVSHTPAGQGTSLQTPGDCKENQCDGDGNPLVVNYDLDTPEDGNECTADLCTDGEPSNPPLDLGESCQTNGIVCDGAGSCVECNAGNECGSGVCSYGTCACANNGECSSGMCYDGSCVGNVNGCDIATAADYTSTPLTITFANGNLTYAPKCVKVAVGAEVTFSGSFGSHPLMGGRVEASNPTPASGGPFVPVTNGGSSKTVTMSAEGTFPYYCVPHGAIGMNGAIFVVAAPSN